LRLECCAVLTWIRALPTLWTISYLVFIWRLGFEIVLMWYPKFIIQPRMDVPQNNPADHTGNCL
jgi:hypothetical protein